MNNTDHIYPHNISQATDYMQNTIVRTLAWFGAWLHGGGLGTLQRDWSQTAATTVTISISRSRSLLLLQGIG